MRMLMIAVLAVWSQVSISHEIGNTITVGQMDLTGVVLEGGCLVNDEEVVTFTSTELVIPVPSFNANTGDKIQCRVRTVGQNPTFEWGVLRSAYAYDKGSIVPVVPGQPPGVESIYKITSVITTTTTTTIAQ